MAIGWSGAYLEHSHRCDYEVVVRNILSYLWEGEVFLIN